MLLFYTFYIYQPENVKRERLIPRKKKKRKTRLNFPSCFYNNSITGQKWELTQFCFKKMLYKFHRAYLNCIWLLCSTPAWLFMVFIEYSHYSLLLCTFINTTSKRHPLRLMIYNCKQDVISHAFANITESCKVILACSYRAGEVLSFNTSTRDVN